MNFWKNRNNSKYGAKKVEHAGYSFASKGEASLFDLLKLMEKAGDIELIQTQAVVYLTDARIMYKPDFKIRDLKRDKIIYIEFKGFETPEWRIKRRLWMAYGETELHVYRGVFGRLKLHEVITPKGKLKEDEVE